MFSTEKGSSALQTSANPIIPSSIPVPTGPAADSRIQRTPKRTKTPRTTSCVIVFPSQKSRSTPL